ncbi:GNAT family N-acetyltransferase [Acidocella sp.]|uniref:GNAT family N-acetyltransferase n=1 Tax=Acidocella sp. TaxID=50710 RepID=UPI002619499A|nr:GNAT family N-acetyltransferase [Acidocella sp.]
MIVIRRARVSDAPGIGAVHVACWRSAYAGLLPDGFLANLSVRRLSAFYEHQLRLGAGLFVAASYGEPAAPGVLGFASSGRSRDPRLAEGEVETLYVLDDYRDRGLGGELLRASARHLAKMGCRSVYAWVLSENPARFFYARMGGRCVAQGSTTVGGEPIGQCAFAWDPIESLLDVNA